jgi:hypothetical protein
VGTGVLRTASARVPRLFPGAAPGHHAFARANARPQRRAPRPGARGTARATTMVLMVVTGERGCPLPLWLRAGGGGLVAPFPAPLRARGFVGAVWFAWPVSAPRSGARGTARSATMVLVVVTGGRGCPLPLWPRAGGGGLLAPFPAPLRARGFVGAVWFAWPVGARRPGARGTARSATMVLVVVTGERGCPLPLWLRAGGGGLVAPFPAPLRARGFVGAVWFAWPVSAPRSGARGTARSATTMLTVAGGRCPPCGRTTRP